MSTNRTVIRSKLAVLLTLATGGCITFQPLEPKLLPPPQYQIDVSARVEFVAPFQIGFRCAERGAKFLGLPGLNSGACADIYLMTIPDPCLTLTAGAYAHVLCEELSRLRREARSSDGRNDEAPPLGRQDERQDTPQSPNVLKIVDTWDASPAAIRIPARAANAKDLSEPLNTASKRGTDEPGPIEVEFVHPSRLTARCAERAATPADGEGSVACRSGSQLTVANPCRVKQQSWYAEMLCHEMSHVNGWAADHRGAVRQTPLPYASESPKALALGPR